MRDFTTAEEHALKLLGAAARAVSDLPDVHPADRGEFVHHMHACQNIVLARPGTEEQR